MQRKRNNQAIIIGIIAVVAFVVTARYTYISREIRINGKLISTPITSISYSSKGKNSARVVIEGKDLRIGRIGNNLHIGDTVAVRYIQGKSRVVQESDKLSGYYLIFALESIFLLLGVFLIVGGFMGKR